MKRLARGALRKAGVQVDRYLPFDFDEETKATVNAVAPYTMTTPQRIYALCNAVRYVVANGVPGAYVECGVWRGGSTMAAARTFLEVGEDQRDLYLFDTFEGMVAPGEHDRRFDGVPAADLLAAQANCEESIWANVSLQNVERAVASVGYPQERIQYVKGRVEETVPSQAPDLISILRLDTDWYESTKHELVHLFPRVVDGGVLIVDDYGAWQGARRAVDEFFQESPYRILLNRIDNTGRIGVVMRSQGPAG